MLVDLIEKIYLLQLGCRCIRGYAYDSQLVSSRLGSVIQISEPQDVLVSWR